MQKGKTKRPTVLLSAYSYGPNRGSEPEVGWQNAIHLSKFCDIKVITTSTFKKDIEKQLNSSSIKNIQFIYFDLPSFLEFLGKKQPYGMLLHYYLWQYFTYRFVKKNRLYKKVDLIHHITFNNFIFPGFWYKLPTPYILGPLGGIATVPPEFYSLLSPSEKIQETIRKILKYYFKKNNCLINYFKKARKIFFANKEIAKKFDITNSNILLDVGVLNIIKKKRYIPNKKRVHIMWAGALTYRKGLILLLWAMNKLKHHDVLLDIYGGGKKMPEYRRYLIDHSITSNIKLRGNVIHKKLLKKYSDYDIFIFTSIRDTSGTVVLEAMAAGLPIICLNHQGVKDIMKAGNCGIAIEPKNPEYVADKIAEAILYYKKNPSKIKKHGLNAQKHINKYTWEKRTKKICKIYNRVVKEKL